MTDVLLRAIGAEDAILACAVVATVEVRCRFCGERYELGADQIAEVFASPAQPAGEDGVVTSHGWHAAT